MTLQTRRISRFDLISLGCVVITAGLVTLSADAELMAIRQWEVGQFLKNGIANLSVAVPQGTHARLLTQRVIQDIDAFLYALSLGLAIIVYRPRHGTWCRRRGPGHVALAIAGGIVAYSFAHYFWFRFGDPRWTGNTPGITLPGQPPTYWGYLPGGNGFSISYAICSGWIYLAMIRGWSRSCEPYERSGRLIGFIWIVTAIITRTLQAIPSY